MRLTSSYSRIAMPPESKCPHCGEVIEDWHREWYIVPGQEQLLYQKKAAADCPLCGGPVYPWQEGQPPAPLESLPGVTVLKRSKAIAEKYCQSQLGMSRKDYIANTVPGQQYVNYQFDP